VGKGERTTGRRDEEGTRPGSYGRGKSVTRTRMDYMAFPRPERPHGYRRQGPGEIAAVWPNRRGFWRVPAEDGARLTARQAEVEIPTNEVGIVRVEIGLAVTTKSLWDKGLRVHLEHRCTGR